VTIENISEQGADDDLVLSSDKTNWNNLHKDESKIKISINVNKMIANIPVQ